MSALLIGYEEDFAVSSAEKVKLSDIQVPDEREERVIRREETRVSRQQSTPRGVRTRSQAAMDEADEPPAPKARRLVLEPIAVTFDNPQAGTSFTRPNFEQQPEVEQIFDPDQATGSSGRVSALTRLAPTSTEVNTTTVVEESGEEEETYGDEEYGEVEKE